jgi:hypothetical protein
MSVPLKLRIHGLKIIFNTNDHRTQNPEQAVPFTKHSIEEQ